MSTALHPLQLSCQLSGQIPTTPIFRFVWASLIFLLWTTAAATQEPFTAQTDAAIEGKQREAEKVKRTGRGESSPVFLCLEEDSANCITEDKYVRAGLIGTFIGFGVGHFVSSETRRGVGFLIGEALALSLVGVGVALFVDVIPMADAMSADIYGGIMYIGGIAVFVGLRIWEKVDIWKRPRHLRPDSKQADAKWPQVSVIPLVLPMFAPVGTGGAVLGLGGRF